MELVWLAVKHILFLTVRQDPLLGSSEMFNSFLRKAQQVGKSVVFKLTRGDLTGMHEPVEVWMCRLLAEEGSIKQVFCTCPSCPSPILRVAPLAFVPVCVAMGYLLPSVFHLYL